MDKFVTKSCDTVCTPGTTKRKAKGLEYNKEYDAEKHRRVFQPKWLEEFLNCGPKAVLCNF